LTPAEARALAAAVLQVPATAAVPCRGGLLNEVFRVTLDGGRTVIVKHAPPHIASQPSVPLDPARSGFEADALRALSGRAAPRLRTPRLLGQRGHSIVIEDLGDLPDLRAWLSSGGDRGVIDTLARGLCALHARDDTPHTHNLPIQQTRLVVQYQSIGPTLAALGVPDAAALGQRAVALGEALLAPGDTFVMGDLWPPSVLVDRGRLSLIDWEMSTRGRRCQDVGHLVAHLWLDAARGTIPAGLAARFLDAYGPLPAPDRAQVAVHAAAEVLVRVAGPFSADPPDPPRVQRAALDFALTALRQGTLCLR